jgi:hypothetical protein
MNGLSTYVIVGTLSTENSGLKTGIFGINCCSLTGIKA